MSITKERTGVWLFIYFVSLISSTALSLLLTGLGHERLAKMLFLWLPLIAIIFAKFLERPLLRRYFELDGHNQWIIRKDAPQSVNILLKLIPIMALIMVGHAFANLFHK